MAARPAARTVPRLRREAQLAMWRRAMEVMPGGADSNFRAWGEDTIYIDRGKGSHIWDLDGNEYIDLRMGYGPVILGHADPRVDDYVNERMRQGVSFSLTSEDEVRAIELIRELTGWVEMARLTVSGTEATMHCMRTARAFTGRDKIVKFEGQYHGVHDYALISVVPDDVSQLGDRDNPVRLAWGRGIPPAVAMTIIPVAYNDTATLRHVFETEGDDIAGVIIEPVLGNAQGIMPARALSVSRQISERNDKKPFGLPSVNGELANSAVATGCNATDTKSFLTMSASDEKSRFTCTVQVRYIISRP